MWNYSETYTYIHTHICIESTLYITCILVEIFPNYQSRFAMWLIALLLHNNRLLQMIPCLFNNIYMYIYLYTHVYRYIFICMSEKLYSKRKRDIFTEKQKVVLGCKYIKIYKVGIYIEGRDGHLSSQLGWEEKQLYIAKGIYLIQLQILFFQRSQPYQKYKTLLM